jgi:hypothetical protein
MLSIIALGSMGQSVRNYSDKTIVRPFGMPKAGPPATARTITIETPTIGISAQQVCGYTDWSTAAIHLPQELLTGKYWQKVTDGLKDQAVKSLLAISGALPSMLACNASPTFCHVLNQAKMLGQAELQFTMDSCEMLDGLANVKQLQSEPLRACIQNRMASDSSLSASNAREQCITSGQLDSKKNDKVNNVANGVNGEPYNSETLLNEICSDVRSSEYQYSKYAYTVSKKRCDWLKDLFPGVTVGAKVTLTTAGTFQPVAEKAYNEEVEKTEVYLVQLLQTMHGLRYGRGGGGPLPRHKVLNHPSVLDKLGMDQNRNIKALCVRREGGECVVDLAQLPPIYRLSLDGRKPTLIIDPSMIYEVVEVVGPDSDPQTEYSKQPSQIELILSRVTQSTAYIKVNDTISESLRRVIATCKTNPKIQGASAQMDCDSKMEILKAEQDSLAKRRETDREYLVSQVEFYSEVNRYRSLVRKVGGETPDRVIDRPREPQSLQ